MKAKSLAFRLFLAAAMWMAIILPLAAVVLVSLYRSAVETSFDVRLNYYLEYLIAASTPSDDQTISVDTPSNLGEPLFSIPASGWYWQIMEVGKDAKVVQRSDSLASERLGVPSHTGSARTGKDAPHAGYVTGPYGQRLREVTREVIMPFSNQARIFAYSVAGEASEVDDAVWSFTRMVVAVLAVLGIGLGAAAFFQVRFGLRPLRDIGARLTAIRSGEAARLAGDLPEEIVPLQRELNALIESNERIVERARTHAGNLAHALKTPLSVITNEARGHRGAFARKVSEQAEIMRQHVAHHLHRAQIAARAGVVGRVTHIERELTAMAGALRKIYEDRQIDVALDCAEALKFQGEKQDFQEMAGNLMDNACKWAHGKVLVHAAALPPAPDPRGRKGHCDSRQIELLIDDDGPGLGARERKAVLERGQRIDQNTPGSGLGLSIVAELAEAYKGEFALEDSPLGGLRARLQLPAA